MINIKIDIDNKSYDLTHPESFNELSSKQYLEVVRLFITEKQAISQRVDDQIRLLFGFIGGFNDKKTDRKQARNIIAELIKQNEGDIDELLKLQSFLTKEQDFNNWLIPKIKLGKTILYGPDNRFSSMTFGEFIVVDMLISAYFGSKKPDAILNKIIAVLFRAERKDLSKTFKGDRRVSFVSETLEDRTELVSQLDDLTKKAILYNYAGVRNWLTKKYAIVFSSPDSSKRTNISLGKKESSWLSIRRHLAGNVLNLERTDKLNLHDVLASLNEEMANN